MNRITQCFNKLKTENKKALIPFICAGDGGLETTEKVVYALAEAGVEAIELGIPFSDPLADSAFGQAAALRALEGGFKIKNYFETVKNIRKNCEIPLVCVVYFSSVIGYGTERFVKDCAESGIDSILILDLPYEEYDEIMPYMENTDLSLVPIVAVTSGDRIPMLVERARTYVYCVSSMGVTGNKQEFDTRTYDLVSEIKKHTDLPVCVGFGITGKADIERFNQIADGCVMGSAFIKRLVEADYDVQVIKDFVKELR